MGDTQTPHWWQELTQGLAKGLVWLLYIVIGVAAKLAFDSREKQLSKREVVIKSVLSIFCGYMSAVACELSGKLTLAKVVVPVATLLGESIIAYLMTHWRAILARIVNVKEKK